MRNVQRERQLSKARIAIVIDYVSMSGGRKKLQGLSLPLPKIPTLSKKLNKIIFVISVI